MFVGQKVCNFKIFNQINQKLEKKNNSCLKINSLCIRVSISLEPKNFFTTNSVPTPKIKTPVSPLKRVTD